VCGQQHFYKSAGRFPLCTPILEKGIDYTVKTSEYKSYDDLPLFLNATMVAQMLGISAASSYELMHEKNFPVLKIGNRMVVPKEKFITWAEHNTNGGGT
jgi:predicted DNA-binding transcriptional regulator AlpA